MLFTFRLSPTTELVVYKQLNIFSIYGNLELSLKLIHLKMTFAKCKHSIRFHKIIFNIIPRLHQAKVVMEFTLLFYDDQVLAYINSAVYIYSTNSEYSITTPVYTAEKV